DTLQATLPPEPLPPAPPPIPIGFDQGGGSFGMAPEGMGPQLPQQDDYWTRVALATGGQVPFPHGFHIGRHPTGLQAALALLAGAANFKAGLAGARYSETEQR